jgi:alcohol dehydrogenase
MKALLYHGADQTAWADVPKPETSADTDAMVRVDAVTIWGTDLHVLEGDLSVTTDERIVDHDAVVHVASQMRVVRPPGRKKVMG